MDKSVLTEEHVKAMPDYLAHRQLPDGRWIAVQRMYTTWGLMVDLDEVGYAHRYCYEHLSAAIRAMEVWDGEYPAPGQWIKVKGRIRGVHVDDFNPNWVKQLERYLESIAP